MKSILTNDFAYLMGNFMADGSLYISGGGYRFEFVDGSPYKKELKYCLKHMGRIKEILENFLDKELPKIIKKDNKFILKFRDKNLAKLFISKLKIFPGKKHRRIDIPHIYKDSIYEKYFWVGFLDGDGSIARQSRKISAESMSKKIIDSLSEYLIKNKILSNKNKSKRGDSYSHVIIIRSVSFRDFAQKIGFGHPLKSKLLNEKLKDKDFHVNNKISDFKSKDKIDYTKFFDDSIFLVEGKRLLLKYNYKKYSRNNIKINEIISYLKKQGLKKDEIINQIIKFRFKKSKGSTNSIKLPLYFSEDLFKISKFVRIRMGGIGFSKRYVESFNENFKNILKITQEIFDIKPKYTCKNEPIFCSGVLSDFFNNIIKRKT